MENERSASARMNVPARRAKIVATLGPASSSEDIFRQLVRAGLDVARLNFSHGSHEQKLELIAMVRKVAREENKPICILADLQGPKIRTGILVDHKPVQLEAGKLLTITPEQIEGTVERVSTVFTTLAEIRSQSYGKMLRRSITSKVYPGVSRANSSAA